ncbi:hypothetical protein ACKKBG_A05315 [Auxenochlorella protothecoides x Auxenochlorella symbiontica]
MDRSMKKRFRASVTARLSFVIFVFLAGVLIGRLGKPLLGESVRATGDFPQTPSWETKALNKEAQGVVKGAQEVVKSAFSRASLTGTSRSIKPGPVRTVCENTCPTARDGVCQDGRPGPGSNATSFYETLHPVVCDLGTDCADCGPWVTTATPEALAWAPVALLRTAETKLLVRRVASPAGYIFGITDPELDTDVSRHVNGTGLFEPVLTLLWHQLLANCVQPDGSRRLVVDVGANFGYYTLMAASLGCRVKAWEPVPMFAAFTQYGLLLNNLTHLVELSDKIVSDSDGASLSIHVPRKGIWGTAAVVPGNSTVNLEHSHQLVVKTTERLDSVVHEDILLMKADVEGFEPSVMRGARDLLLKRSVENIIMEYSPGVGDWQRDWDKSMSNPIMLKALIEAGYFAYDLPWSKVYTYPGFNVSMPVLERVLTYMLDLDIQDMQRAKLGKLGCELKQELPEHAAYLPDCNKVPQALHPHSYHSSFGFNTNVWLTRSSAVNSSGVASVAPLTFNPAKEYFLPNNVAMSRNWCGWYKPEELLAQRCPCVEGTPCAAASKAVEAAAREGKLAPYPVPSEKFKHERVEAW